MTRHELSAFLKQQVYTCVVCGTDFTPTRRTSKYCSRSCNNKHHTAKYRQTDKRKVTKKRYEDANKHKKAALVRAYQHKKYKYKLSSIEKMMVDNYYEDAQKLSKETGIPYHVDHIIPICMGGPHHPYNLRVITADENRRKGGKL